MGAVSLNMRLWLLLLPLLALAACTTSVRQAEKDWQDIVAERLDEAAQTTPPLSNRWFYSCPAAAELLTEVNTYRESQNLTVLKPDPALTRAAMIHAADMASRDYFAHTSPDGTTLDQRVHRAGYPRWARAENLSQTNTAELAMTLWQQSRLHRSNLELADAYFIGTGCAEVKPGLYNWVVILGR